MSVSPVFVQNRKSTARVFQSPGIGVDGELPEINKYRYFRAGEAITAGQWVSLNLGSDLRQVFRATNSIGTNFCIGVAVETVTGPEATAGKLIKVQIAGMHPAASISTGGALGWWACLGATNGLCERIDPAALTPTAAEVRALGDRVGLLMETASSAQASVWILPRLV